MPAEWEPHAATWIAWPHNTDDWPGRFEPVPWVYGEIVRHLARVEPVHIIVNSVQLEADARKILASVGVDLISPLEHGPRVDPRLRADFHPA